MASFNVTGDPRFQPPPSASRTAVNNNPAIDTHAGFRQFEWLAQVSLTGADPDGYEVGLIQNMLACRIDLNYTSGEGDQSPVKAGFVVSPLPILDSKIANAIWLGGNFNVLGTITQGPNVILPPGLSRSNSLMSAGVNGGDDPGGTFPVTHPQQPTKMLRGISEQLDFVTWIAVRKRGSNPADVSSYQFLKNLGWGVRRTTIVHYNPSGNFAMAFTENSTRMTSFGVGMGSQNPVLKPPIANQSGRFTGIVLP